MSRGRLVRAVWRGGRNHNPTYQYVASAEEEALRLERAMPNPREPVPDDEPRIIATFEEDYQ